MMFEEAKTRNDYKFQINDWFYRQLKEIRNSKFEDWTEYDETNGVHEWGNVVLEIGWIDIELNISCEYDENGNGINKPLPEYFCCVKGKTGVFNDSVDWCDAGYLDDFDYEVEVDWNADNWKEQLERDMFNKLVAFAEEFDLKFDEPNWNEYGHQFDCFDRIHGIVR